MEKRSIALRPAVPTLDEGRVFARYLDVAAEGFFRFMLGRCSVDIIAKAFIEPGHDLSYQHVIFAEREGDVVGMVSSYTAEQHRLSSDRPLRQAAGNRTLRMMAVAMLCAPLLRHIDKLGHGDSYLQAIAVDRACRGEGIGAILLDAAEDRARAGGSARLTLDVLAGNKGAQRLYGRFGMTVESAWPKLFFVPPMLFRMAKTL